MSESGAASFRIGADPANVQKAFGQLVGMARSVNQALTAETRKAARDREKIEKDALRSIDRSLREQQREMVRAANERKRLEDQAARDAKKAVDKMLADKKKAEIAATKTADKEAKARVKSESDEARERVRIAATFYEAKKKAEEEATRVTEREERKRARAAEMLQRQRSAAMFRMYQQDERARVRAQRTEERQASRFWGGVRGGIGTVAQAGMGTLTSMIGEVQGARMSRADVDRTMNLALFQAGGTRRDAVTERAMVHRFAADNGINAGELAGALNAAQTEFSVLGDSRTNASTRQRNLQGFLRTAMFARDTGQDIGEVARVNGMLQQSGIGDTRSTLLALTGMAQRGAIELGAVTRTAMAPMQRRIAQATTGLAANDTAGREHATQQAVLQTFAEMEVARGLGSTPRAVGNVMAQLGGSLQSDVVQQRMLNNLQHAHRTSAIAQLFEQDSHGQRHLRSEYQTGFGLATGLMTAFNGDATAMRNTFAGGGHGNAQSLQSNWRDMLGAFMGQGNDRVGEMMRGAGRDFTEADVQRGHDLFGSDEKSKVTSEAEVRENNLLDNTGAIRDLNATLQTFRAQNPLVASFANHLGGDAIEVAAGRFREDSDGNGARMRSRFAAIEEQSISDRIFGHENTARANQIYTAENISTAAKSEKGVTPEVVAEALRRALRGAPIAVTVDMHTAAQAQATRGRP